MRIRQAMSLKSKSSYTFYPFYWSCSFVPDSPWSSQGQKHNYQLTPVNPLNINKYLMRFVVLLLNTLKEMFQISFILTTHRKYKVDGGKTYSYMFIYSSHNMSIFNWYMLREVLIIFTSLKRINMFAISQTSKKMQILLIIYFWYEIDE